MRQVDLSVLPKRGKVKPVIDWKNSVGIEIPFVYDGLEGTLSIKATYRIDDGCTRLVVAYGDVQEHLTSNGLKLGMIQNIVMPKQESDILKCEFYEGQIIKDENRHIQLVKQKRSERDYWMEYGYEYKCLKCGHSGYKTLGSLRNGTGCKLRKSSCK